MDALTVGLATGELRLEPGRTYAVGREVGSDVLLSAPSASRRHAFLRHTPDGWVLQDAGSANGTWINGHRIDACSLIGTVDVLFGDATQGEQVRITAPSTAEPAPAAAPASEEPAPVAAPGASYAPPPQTTAAPYLQEIPHPQV